MARLTRIVAAGVPHHVVQHGHDKGAIVRDDDDRRAFIAQLRDAAVTYRVDLHAWLLLDDHFHLIATPRVAADLSRMMQALGRRYVAYFNRRHGRTGTLWNGRFRCTLLQPDRWLLTVTRYVEQHPVRSGLVDKASRHPWSSLAQHVGMRADPLVTMAPAYWVLGNTPFEREAAYRGLVETPLADEVVAEVTLATRRGWPLASADFLKGLVFERDMPERRPRGRPRKRAAP